MQVMRRWQAIFKRADTGDIETDKLMLAEYYKSLGHLGPHGWDLLTEELKTRCTFFPTIKECLEVINPARYDYASPFYRTRRDVDAIGSPEWMDAARLDYQEAKRLTDERE